MDPLWSETGWSTFKYFSILIVTTYYILCISWIIKCLSLRVKLIVGIMQQYFSQNLRQSWCNKAINGIPLTFRRPAPARLNTVEKHSSSSTGLMRKYLWPLPNKNSYTLNLQNIWFSFCRWMRKSQSVHTTHCRRPQEYCHVPWTGFELAITLYKLYEYHLRHTRTKITLHGDLTG